MVESGKKVVRKMGVRGEKNGVREAKRERKKVVW